MPDGYTPKKVDISYICNNIAEGTNLTLTLQADSALAYSDAFKTNNDDIGVLIKDATGNVILPNQGEIPMTLDNYGADDENGSLELFAAPVNTTGNTPSPGDFSAIATIVVNMK